VTDVRSWAPLAMFLPRRVVESGLGDVKVRRDWNLTLIAICMGCSVLIMSSYQYKFQYASAQFGWATEQLGYWISATGFVRAAYLMAILPLILKYLKPKRPGISLPTSDSPTSSSPLINSEQAQLTHAYKSTRFDLWLARVSLMIDIISYILLTLVRTPTMFFAISLLGSLGSGLGPAKQSVALELYLRTGETETGKLFGALSVAQAICSQIIGPTLFGLVYASTVVVFPQTLFIVCAAALTIALCASLLIRLKPQEVKEANGDLVYT